MLAAALTQACSWNSVRGQPRVAADRLIFTDRSRYLTDADRERHSPACFSQTTRAGLRAAAAPVDGCIDPLSSADPGTNQVGEATEIDSARLDA